MSRVRTRDTQPERLVRSLLHGLGYRFRLHREDLPGTPDIVLPKYRAVVLVHGCFWHSHAGCSRGTPPASKRDFWDRKLGRTRERDQENIEALTEMGWSPMVVWECETKDLISLAEKLRVFLSASQE